MASVGSRPGPDGEVIENLIAWATAVPPKPDLCKQWRIGRPMVASRASNDGRVVKGPWVWLGLPSSPTLLPYTGEGRFLSRRRDFHGKRQPRQRL